MTRQEIEREIKNIFQREFEIENPGFDDDLREKYEFDSIDAIELLLEIERMLGSELTQEEKKQAMDIRTINQICDYIERIIQTRSKAA
jgi:acyl carrier protein